MLIFLTIGITGFLCILNIFFAVAFRKRRIRELLSYLAASLIELAILGTALAIQFGILIFIPYHLAPGLPFNRAEIGAALAVGIGLLPAVYWRRTSVSQLRTLIAQDAKGRSKGGVSIRDWMN